MLKRVSLIIVLPLLLAFALVNVVDAGSKAKVYIVHGIPDAVVDVCVDGAAAIEDFTFTTIAGPVALPAGAYDIALAAPDGTCSTIILGPLTLNFDAGVNYSVVAHLTEAGDPTASQFVNDVSRTGRGKARIIAHHTAAAPAVDVIIARNYDSGAQKLVIEGFANGDQAQGEVRPGDWQVALEAGGATAYGPITLEGLQPFTGYLVYAVGVFGTDSFQFLVQPVRGLR